MGYSSKYSYPIRKFFAYIIAFIFLSVTILSSESIDCLINQNPYDDDDDDAIYKYIRFRTRPKEAVIMSVLSILVVLPAFQTLYWALSKPGRKYVKREEDTETQVSVV